MPHSECIMLHVGQAGVQVGHACWELFCLEHGIYPNGQMACGLMGPDAGSHNTFFAEKVSGHFVPRTILFDTEPTVIDEVRTGAYRHLFSPDMMISGKEDAANNYARGYYTTGREYIGVMMERLRRQSEMCDALQGFFLCRSIGGGTGSGFVAYFLEKLSSTFGKKTRISLDVFPSPNISTAVVEPYNSLLTTHSTMDNTDVTFIYDNEALYRICGTQLTNHRPTYHNLNRIIAQVISAMTASVRFSGGSNVSIREFQTNLVPYPRVHFPLVAYAPIVSAEQAYHERFGVNQLVRGIFESHNQMVTCDTTKGKYMAVSLLFRGDVTPNDVNFTLQALRAGTCSGRGKLPFVDWAPNAYKVGLCARPPVCVPGGDLAETPRAVVGMMNTTAIRQPWRRLVRKFNVMFQKRAFVHWYVGEGMEEAEFKDAREDLMALYDDYELINRGRSDKVKLSPVGQSKKDAHHPIDAKFAPPKPNAQKAKAR